MYTVLNQVGGTIGSEASLNKIFWSEMDVRTHELALQILGPEAERTTGPMARSIFRPKSHRNTRLTSRCTESRCRNTSPS